jgi:glycerol-3-phosphate dehydrogenase (NAD(P)+)
VAVVTILGAGAMGSALTTPALAAGHQVRLWGTWLDGDILAALRAGRPHPRIAVPIDSRAELFDAGDLGRALDGADLVVLAISSDGAVDVLGRAAEHLAGVPLLVTTKGFGRDREGRVRLLPPLLAAALPAGLRDACPLVAIGGPCKANEVAAGRPTAAVFACTDLGAAEEAAAALSTAAYRVATTDDIDGVEASAALKNVYAIALGLADGLGERDGEPWHNLKAATFAQATAELAVIAAALGGRPETATGLAGVGDLEVTGLSGRNKVYGARIGAGEPAAAALDAMVAAEQTVEGVAAARLAAELAAQLGLDGLPLLAAIVAVLDGQADPAGRVIDAALPSAPGRGYTRSTR